MKIDRSGFYGMVPKVRPRKLDVGFCQLAKNVILDHATIAPLEAPAAIEVGSAVAAGTKGIFYYRGAWLTWTEFVDVCLGPIANDLYDRIYYSVTGETPKVRGWTGTAQQEWDLGVPQPTVAPTCVAQDKSTTTWTRVWHYRYENTAGQITQSGDLVEGALSGTNIFEETPGRVYQANQAATPTTASIFDDYIIYFEAYDADGSFLGTMFPNTSASAANRDCYVNGAKVSGALTYTIGIPGPDIELTLSYDKSRTSDYEADRYYVETLVSAWGEEGAPSPVSLIIPIDPSQDCLVTSGTVSVAGNYQITKKRLYRTVTSAAGTYYFYVMEADLATTTYLDTFSDSDVGEIIPSTFWYPPESDLEGLVSVAEAFFAGFVDNTVYFSEPNYPHAWPNYGRNVDYPIVGLAPTSTGLIVFTTGQNYIMTGSHPAELSMDKIDSTQFCVNRQGIAIVDEGSSVIYPSQDGIVMISSGVPNVITQTLYTRDQWQEFDFDSFIGVVHERKYILFHSTGALIVDLIDMTRALTVTDETAAGLRYDPEQDALFIVQDDTIMEWRAGAAKQMEWTDRVWTLNRPGAFSWARVCATDYPVAPAVPTTLRLYAEDVLVHTVEVQDDKPFRLPILRHVRYWTPSIIGPNEVYQVSLATSIAELTAP